MTDLLQRQSDLYDALLMEYACGALDETLSFLLAAHLTLSPEARQAVAVYECMGGVLIEDGCIPVNMNKTALHDVLAQLDCEKAAQRCCPSQDMREPQAGLPLPQPLCEFLERCGRPVKWHNVLPGISLARLQRASEGLRMRLYRLRPGARLPRRAHTGTELTLVIDGVMLAGDVTHHRGTLIIRETSSAPVSRAGSEDCLCLVVGGGHHTGLPGLIEKLLLRK